MCDLKLVPYWKEIPIGKENALNYTELMNLWNCSERAVRSILHDLSHFDNGDNYVLIRSSAGKGFYKTDNEEIIKQYRKECLNKGKSIFAPLKKIDRILNANIKQYTIDNNLRVVRESKGYKQATVCKFMKQYDRQFDVSLLSKMENGVCLPTPAQLAKLAVFYTCKPFELINSDLY